MEENTIVDILQDPDENYKTGYVKLYRSLMKKAFYSKDSDKVHLWIHLLMKANHKGYEGMLFGSPTIINPGQFLTGRSKLSEETGINESKIERILTYFEKIEQQIEQQKNSVNRLITILNWSEYQNSEQQIEQRVNNDRTTSEQRVNTNKNEKNKKNIIYDDFKKFYYDEIEKSQSDLYRSFVDFLYGKNIISKPLNKVLHLNGQISFDLFTKLTKEYKNDVIKQTILDLENYTKKTYKYFDLTLIKWLKKTK